MRISDWSSDVCSSDLHFLDFDGLRAGDVTFWSIHRDDELPGCGALKMLDTKHGEIKSMRTAEAFLRQGVAAHMLDYIIDAARADRKSVVWVKSVSVRVYIGGRRIIKKKNTYKT